MRKILSLVVVLIVAGFAISASAANMTFMTVTAQKQGVLKGDIATKEHKDAINVLSFSMEVDSPRDAASGLPTGKRLHKPVVVTKDLDAASPQLFQALATNENLKTVVFEFAKTGVGPGTGAESTYYKITLTGANIASIRQFTADANNGHAPAGTALEEISLTYQKIEVESVTGKTTATDDWQTK